MCSWPSTGPPTEYVLPSSKTKQRHGRTLQSTTQPGAALAPLQQCARPSEGAAQVCIAVQPPLAAKGTGTCCLSASAQTLEYKSAAPISKSVRNHTRPDIYATTPISPQFHRTK